LIDNGTGQGREIHRYARPQGPDYCSVELFEKIKKTAVEHDLKIHMHIGQGGREILQMKNRYGKRPVEFLESIGYLNRR